MAKKLNTVQVNMQFNTDTHKAKQQMQDLQNSLTRLLNSPTQINIDASKIREATIATTETAFIRSVCTATGTWECTRKKANKKL